MKTKNSAILGAVAVALALPSASFADIPIRTAANFQPVVLGDHQRLDLTALLALANLPQIGLRFVSQIQVTAYSESTGSNPATLKTVFRNPGDLDGAPDVMIDWNTKQDVGQGAILTMAPAHQYLTTSGLDIDLETTGTVEITGVQVLLGQAGAAPPPAPPIFSNPNGPIVGNVDGLVTGGDGQIYLQGWTCIQGDSRMIDGDIYLGGGWTNNSPKDGPSGLLIVRVAANLSRGSDDAAVEQECQAPGVHGFMIPLQQLRQTAQQKMHQAELSHQAWANFTNANRDAIFVHGIRSPGGPNPLLPHSGEFHL